MFPLFNDSVPGVRRPATRALQASLLAAVMALAACGGSGGGASGGVTQFSPVTFKGTVVESGNAARPVAGASVSIATTAAGSSSIARVLADASGKFIFDTLTAAIIAEPTAAKPVYLTVSASGYTSKLVTYTLKGQDDVIGLEPLVNRVVLQTNESAGFTVLGDGDAVATNENTLLAQAGSIRALTSKTFVLGTPTAQQWASSGSIEVSYTVAALQNCKSAVSVNGSASVFLEPNEIKPNNLTVYEPKLVATVPIVVGSTPQAIEVTITAGKDGPPCAKTEKINGVTVPVLVDGRPDYEYDDFIFYGLSAELKPLAP